MKEMKLKMIYERLEQAKKEAGDDEAEADQFDSEE